MNRRQFGKALCGLAIVPAIRPPTPLAAQGAAWAFRADLAECCSCEIPCPCNFGRPTAGSCHGTRLIEIREGSIDGMELGGARFVLTFNMREWNRLYLDDAMPAATAAALDRLLPVAFAGYQSGARAIERVPLTVTRTSSTVRFEVPESTIEMRLLPGLDGQPIVISNLPSNAYQNYVQYEAVVHEHSSVDGRWSHVGTNGFTSEMRASG